MCGVLVGKQDSAAFVCCPCSHHCEGIVWQRQKELLLTKVTSGILPTTFFILLPIIFWEDDIFGIAKNDQKQLAQNHVP